MAPPPFPKPTPEHDREDEVSIDIKTVEIQPLRHTFTHVARLIGGDKPASRYQEATLGFQQTANFHYRPTWDLEHDLFDAARSAIQMEEWDELRDPRQFYYATWTQARARQFEAVEANFNVVESHGMLAALQPALIERVLDVLTPLRHVAWGANMNNSQTCALGYGMAFTAPAMFYAADQLGIAQLLTRLALMLGDADDLARGKEAWLAKPAWQELRRLMEDSFVLTDPVELFVVQDVVLDGMLYPLIYGGFVQDRVVPEGGAAIGLLTAFMTEWHEETGRWIDAVLRKMAASPANAATLSGWAKTAIGRTEAALAPIAALALGEKGSVVLAEVGAGLRKKLAKAGLSV